MPEAWSSIADSCEDPAVARNSGRTGLPLTNAFDPKNAAVESNVTAADRTTRASNRLVNPGTAFCSSSIVGTPRAAVLQLNHAFTEALASPDIQAYFAEVDITSVASTPEAMQAAIAHEIPLWRDVVKKAGIKAD